MPLIVLLGASALLVGLVIWSYSAYYLVLAALARRRSAQAMPPAEAAAAPPDLHVVIPCYQEREMIRAKLENTADLQHPGGAWHVYVVDGGSTDGTVEIAREFCAERERFTFLAAPRRGKIQQLNHALEQIDAGVVVITDVDGVLPSDFLAELLPAYRDPRAGCVGAFVTPDQPIPEDAHFWRHQNAMRLLESDLGHCSVMIAVAYSFRRELFDRFPDDVVADDVFVGFSANTGGRRSLYRRELRAVERRAGSSSGEMFRHKLRKLNANMRELKRFWPELGAMASPWRMMYLTKFAQSWLVAPVLIALAGLCAATLLLAPLTAGVFWGGALIAALVSQVVAGRVLDGVVEGVQERAPAGGKSMSYLLVFQLILIAGFFRFFVVEQSSSYQKVE